MTSQLITNILNLPITKLFQDSMTRLSQGCNKVVLVHCGNLVILVILYDHFIWSLQSSGYLYLNFLYKWYLYLRIEG